MDAARKAAESASRAKTHQNDTEAHMSEFKRTYSRFLTCILILSLFSGIWYVAQSERAERDHMHASWVRWAQENGVTYSDPLTTR